MSIHYKIQNYKIQLLFPELEKIWGNTFSQANSIGGI